MLETNPSNADITGAKVLSVSQLNVTLAGQAILRDIAFELNAGEILGLVGPSGCGKTTLLNTIAGFIAQQRGSISIAGKAAIHPDNMLAPEKRQVGMIFQDYALFPHLTVEQNIAFGLSTLPKAEQAERVNHMLALLALSGFNQRYPHELSGGQQQRVAIARAIAPQPKLLLLDEPFSNIDARLRQSLMLELRQLFKQLQITAIFVTHNKDEVFTFADKMAVMAQGEILQFGSPADICQAPNSYHVADFLQLGSWLPCEVNGENLVSALGEHQYSDEQVMQFKQLKQAGSSYQLLVKPNHIEFVKADRVQHANMEVVHIGVAEQGFHYHLQSIAQSNPLAISQLSIYSEQALVLQDKLQVSIKPHPYLVFTTD
ncbi:ABC transporter ATP-binding protein [Thalassotalea euphylliae]|uniref:ABC transporter ATP-binding protein n=1 Tax=Thalassotalea euphylliae TaxID=1655234 RepID=A0A3E0TUM1_9GAMM|nr:ABC transporter ATP-binding protein [Thalassotalea euphylliae]REL28083.1 ABC transporter ATP-binding protein [Thalassotalea euphylliae]